jgi:branched-chain amino acid transport system ATP-binding protein/branched-chain amino acid transport system permease protein
VVVLLLLPVVLDSFRLFFAAVVLCYVIVAVGLNVVMGYSGQISVAHAGLMGIGAYTTTLLVIHARLPVVVSLFAGAVVTTAVGCFVAVPALRIKGHYLALATLAFQLIVETVISNWIAVTGGPNGLEMPTVDVFGLPLDDPTKYALVGLVVLATVILARNLGRSRFGRALLAVRDNDLVARVMGVDVTRHKVQAFAVSAFFTGLGGGLFAVVVGFLDPAAFTVWESVRLLVMVIFGGMATVLGPVIGAAVIGGAPEALSGFDQHWPIIYFVMLLLVLVFLPTGVVGGLQRLLARSLPDGLVRSRHEYGVRDGATLTESPADVPAGPPPVEQSGPLLEVKGVSLRFGGLQALTNVDLSVRPGEVAGLIGPNGAGKTTLFNVMTRVLRPDEGSIRFGDVDLLGHRTHEVVALGLSRTFQNVELCSSLTVAENVILGMHHRLPPGLLRYAFRAFGVVAAERQASVEARRLLADLGLREHADTAVGELPLGLQRRVELARALAARPRAVLLDEPASGLSAEEAVELMADVRRLQRHGIAVLVIEHNVEFVMGLCERVTVLDNGEVIFQGSAAEAQRDARVIEAYLGREEYSHAEN